MTHFSISVLRPGSYEKSESLSSSPIQIWGLTVNMEKKDEDLQIQINGQGEAVVTLWYKPRDENFFPLLPGFMIGFNRPEDTGPFYPQLTPQQNLNHPFLQSPYWGIRADRATLPAVMVFEHQEVHGLSIPPYLVRPDGSHTVNGLRVCLRRGVGVSMGHTVEPVQYIHNGITASGYRGYHRFHGKENFSCKFFSRPSIKRKGHASIIRRLYELNHEVGTHGDGVKASVQMTSDALEKDILIPAQTTLRESVAGELFKIKDGVPSAVLTEIGWTGGAMVAYPLLQLQKRYSKPLLEAYAIQRLDRICASINPSSGFFWDCQHAHHADAKGWWTELEPEAHYSYTQGHACYYLLKSASLNSAKAGKWIEAAGKVLERVLLAQQSDGTFPAAFSIHDGSIINTTGFAGCWFSAALLEWYRYSKNSRHLDAAIRSIKAYHSEIINLTPCGTPMDTHNAVDQEGNLALLHAAAAWNKEVKNSESLEILQDSADFEMLWRYYYNVRAPFPPLDTAQWGSCGGSVTSTHNPHIHKMHLNSLDQILHLYDQTGDPYYLKRTEDAVRYGCACVCRPSEDFGWGKPGWLCERFCPSDGLIIQHYLKTGEPWSAGCDYHPWNVAVLLEGLTGEAWERFPHLA